MALKNAGKREIRIQAQKGPGGARPGGGRVKAGGIPFAQVREYAEAGCTAEDITEALGISQETLNDPETLARFRDVVKRGNAMGRLLLQEAIAKRGRRTVKGAGSVNALAIRARNLLDWDKGLTEQEPSPDLTSAHARLRCTFEKLAAAKTEEFGRLVTPAMILICEVYGIELTKVAGCDTERLLAFVAGELPGKVN